MTDALAPFFVDDRPVPARIELVESSGPVSPRFQYDLELAIDVGPAEISVQRREARGGSEPTTTVSTLSDGEYRALAGDLLACGVLDVATDALDASVRGRVGVSFNHLSIDVGARTIRVDYLLSSLKRADAARVREIVERLKRVGAG